MGCIVGGGAVQNADAKIVLKETETFCLLNTQYVKTVLALNWLQRPINFWIL
jgi:hypothetical protein